MSVHLILYSKPGCHLCEGLHEKLAQIQSLDLELEIRDITTRDDWFQAYQYEIPVLVLAKEGRESGVGSWGEEEAREAGVEEGAGDAIHNSKLTTRNSQRPPSLIPLPRPSPRASVQQLEQMLRQYL